MRENDTYSTFSRSAGRTEELMRRTPLVMQIRRGHRPSHIHIRPAHAFCATVSLLLLVGCSDAPPSSRPGSTASVAGSASTPSGRPPTADSPPIAHRTGTVLFSSPSRNITCWISDDPQLDAVRCDVLSHTWIAPASARPKDCLSDYGSSVGIVHGKGVFVCVSDAIGQPPILPYGAGYDVGTARCVSTTEGMRCVDRRSGHGFLVSRQVVHLL